MNVTEIPYEVRKLVERMQPAGNLEGIDVARRVAAAAESLAREYARRARGHGHSWVQIAEATRIEESIDPAADAFLRVAPEPSMRFDIRRVLWTCASCGADVVDSGPYGGHPDDNEEGHAAGCVRHEEEVVAYLRLAGWYVEDEHP